MSSLCRTLERKMFFAGMNKKQRKAMKGDRKWSEIKSGKRGKKYSNDL